MFNQQQPSSGRKEVMSTHLLFVNDYETVKDDECVSIKSVLHREIKLNAVVNYTFGRCLS